MFDFADSISALVDLQQPESQPDKWKVDSPMFSISGLDIERRKAASVLRNDISFEIEHREISDAPRKCVYWAFNKMFKVGEWHSEGCIVTSQNMYSTSCQCDKLGSFVLLVDTSFEDKSLKIVSNVSICLCMLSIAAAA